MDRSTAILVTLVVFQAAVLALGLLARSRTRDAAEYFLGGRSLGPWVAALAANASSSSAWSLLGVSGFAYRYGLASLWLLPGCIGGFAMNYFLVARPVRDASGTAITLTELLAGPPGRPGRRAVVWLASLLTLGSLLTYVSAQMRGAGDAFAHVLATPDWQGVLIGAAVVLVYTAIGGYLAASITDTLQGLLMVAVALLLPLAALAHLGGPAELAAELDRLGQPFLDPFGGRDGLVAVGFAFGLLGIGLGYPGQPHAINKFMGMAPGASLRTARLVGMSWAGILYCGMVLLGLCGRALAGLPPSEQGLQPLPEGLHERVLYAVNDLVLPPMLGGFVIAAVLSAIMSTVDSQLLVCGSTVTHDLGLGKGSERDTLRAARWTVLAISAGALLAALLVTTSLFDHVLFAWSALGSAFGPVLLVHLFRGPVRPWWAFAAMASGGGLAILFYFVPVLAKGFGDRVLAWVAALALSWIGARRGQPR
jgi:sodium/proline symporter